MRLPGRGRRSLLGKPIKVFHRLTFVAESLDGCVITLRLCVGEVAAGDAVEVHRRSSDELGIVDSFGLVCPALSES